MQGMYCFCSSCSAVEPGRAGSIRVRLKLSKAFASSSRCRLHGAKKRRKTSSPRLYLTLNCPSLHDISEHVLRDTPVGYARRWVAPGAEELRRVALGMRGACGGDGWSGDELSCLPAGVWDLFATLSERWLQSGCLPEPLLHARTVYLVKEHKVKDNCLRADHARPITVLSGFWRCFASAWLEMPQTEEWIRSFLHPSVVYGKGGDAQVAAGLVLQSFAEDGFCASLDYTKCFDTLRPEVSTAALEKHGFDSRMTKLCGLLWSRHVRWQSWDGHVDASPMRARLAIPQGDPFGPLICAVWLSAGARFLDRTLPVDVAGDGVSSIFMDDRTFTATSPQVLRLKYDAWSLWSGHAGLLESGDKAQFTGRKAAHQKALLPFFDQDTLRANILFLGVVSRGKPRSNHEKEAERVATAVERLLVLGSLRLGTEVVGRYANMFALSVVSYGWIARLPTWQVSNKIWSAVKRAQNVAWMSNKWLRAVVLGGNSHVDVRSACNLFRILWHLRRQGNCQWKDVAYSPLWALRKWLKERGWSENAPWCWGRQGIRLSLRANAQLDVQLHMLRSGWREYCWNRFVSKSGRHEVVDLGLANVEDVRRCDFKRLRELMKNPACRTVCLGATVSPAWFRERHVFSDRCLWCDALGTWRHLCWDCKASPLKSVRPAIPRCPLLLRLGWGSKKESDSVLPYLAQVQTYLWRSRWDG